MPKRTIAIGDIHGCSIALRALIEAINPSAADTIVTLGDYIDRGPDSRGVIDQLIALQERCHLIPLMGNHEEMLLAAMDSRSELVFWINFGGHEMLDSYGKRGGWDIIPREHIQFVKSCRRYHETDRHIFVHASCWPNRRMEDQSPTTLLWENFDRQEPAIHYSGKTVIVGHKPQVSGEVLDLGFLKCIDTFCHGGGWLTGLDVETGDCWQANQDGIIRKLSIGGQGK
jgi:serine/threonine protein phosphatase 1